MDTSYHIDIQHAIKETIPVSDEDITSWTTLTLSKHQDAAELTIRLVAKEEMKELNHSYRKKDKPTNVLAFPAELPPDIELDYPFLGDVIICPEVLKKESEEFDKPLKAHWAHIVIHGVLHLLGYDHIEEQDAKTMQKKEKELLACFSFDNPYEEGDSE